MAELEPDRVGDRDARAEGVRAPEPVWGAERVGESLRAADVEGDAEGEGVRDTDPVSEGDAEGEGEEDADCDAEPEEDTEPEGVSEGEAAALPVAEAEKEALPVAHTVIVVVLVRTMEPDAKALVVPPRWLKVLIALALPDAVRAGVLLGEGVLDSEPEKDVVCVAQGVAEPDKQPEADSVGECDVVEDTLAVEEGAPEGEGSAEAEGLSESELEKLPEPELELDMVVASVLVGTAETDDEPLSVGEPLGVEERVVEPVVERDAGAGVRVRGADGVAPKENVPESEGANEVVTDTVSVAVAEAGADGVWVAEGEADTVRDTVPEGLCVLVLVSRAGVGELDTVSVKKMEVEGVEDMQGDTELEALSVLLPLVEPDTDVEMVA